MPVPPPRVEGEGGFRTVFGLPLGLVRGARAQHDLFIEVLDYLGVETGRSEPAALAVRFERFAHVQVGEDWPVVVGAVAPEGVDAVTVVHRPYGAVSWQRIPLAVVAFINTVISLYYYAKVVKSMFLYAPGPSDTAISVGGNNVVLLIPLTALTIIFGVYFGPLIRYATESLRFFVQ
jgi:hypothetical protein